MYKNNKYGGDDCIIICEVKNPGKPESVVIGKINDLENCRFLHTEGKAQLARLIGWVRIVPKMTGSLACVRNLKFPTKIVVGWAASMPDGVCPTNHT